MFRQFKISDILLVLLGVGALCSWFVAANKPQPFWNLVELPVVLPSPPAEFDDLGRHAPNIDLSLEFPPPTYTHFKNGSDLFADGYRSGFAHAVSEFKQNYLPGPEYRKPKIQLTNKRWTRDHHEFAFLDGYTHALRILNDRVNSENKDTDSFRNKLFNGQFNWRRLIPIAFVGVFAVGLSIRLSRSLIWTRRVT